MSELLLNLDQTPHMRRFFAPKRGHARLLVSILFIGIFSTRGQVAGSHDSAFIEGLKKQALAAVNSKEKSVQEMVDMIFSFGELGFQEFETSKYLVSVLEKNGFTVEKGVSGIPTSWIARWGSGSPV